MNPETRVLSDAEVAERSGPAPVRSARDSVIEIIPGSYFERLQPGVIFGRAGPLEVDVGCGGGSFLAARAAKYPLRNFLGLERQAGRVRKSCRRAERLRLDNVRVLGIESGYAVRYLLAESSVTVFHVAFPDPWPKRRHEQRRLISPEFLDAVRVALVPSGELRVTTDDRIYFEQISTLGAGRADLVPDPWEPGADYPQTDFERIFRGQGVPIYRLRLRKV